MSSGRFAMADRDYLALLGLAARLLGWSPTAFWAATPRELAAALSPPVTDASATTPLSRDELAALVRRFPDHKRAPTAASVISDQSSVISHQ